ncbi:CU044_5270 family protein [Streptomyces sp. NPDC047046]|uniref:CU044_5270 family protein n=1 Tax=Streptomyces sp. NPDC047046 TaxID=3155378 RepID=UPI0033C71125
MNATPEPRPTEWPHKDALLPPVIRELPPGRHEFHKERLMAQIHADTERTNPSARQNPARPRAPWWRRPVLVLPLAACALAGALVTGSALTGDDEGTGLATGPLLTTQVAAATTHGTGGLLQRASVAAEQAPLPAPRPGQYIYIESVTANTYVRTRGDDSEVVSEKLHRRQVWESPDGHKGWLVEPGNPKGGITLDTKVDRDAAYDALVTLPKDPDALLRRIYAMSEGQGNGPDQAAFSTIGGLISESYPPAGLEAALYQAAAKIPGVVALDDAVDAAGRHGVAIARLDEKAGLREEWIFDRKSLTFLGERTVLVRQPRHANAEDRLIKPGTILFTSAVTKRTLVEGMKEAPSQRS